MTAVKIDYAQGDKLVQDTLDAARTRHTDTIHEFGSENARILVLSKATQNRELIRRQISNYRIKSVFLTRETTPKAAAMSASTISADSSVTDHKASHNS